MIYKAIEKVNKIKRVLTGEGAKTKYTKYLQNIQHLPIEKLREIQALKLSYLLQYSFDNIEAYKSYKNQIDLSPETIFDEVKHITPLTKQDIINQSQSHINHELSTCIKRETGGTSSNSTVIYKGISEHLFNADNYFNLFNGITPGKSRIILRAFEMQKKYQLDEHPEVMYIPFKNSYYFVPYSLDEQKLQLLYNICITKKPKIIWGITRPVYDFARYIQDTNKTIPPFELCMTSGQTLLPHHRKVIEQVYQAPLINKYASTECWNVANQCLHREGLHYCSPVHYIEILDANLNHVAEGQRGEMYITILNSRYFPMIRYKTNDYAIYTEKPCSCGITYPVLQQIEGRNIESIRAPNLSVVSPVPIDKILFDYPNIKEFQVIQSVLTGYDLNLVIDGSLTKELQYEIKKRLIPLHGCDMNISINKTKTIQSEKSGKILHIKSTV